MISATNRPDVLDPALLRPGRFDRQIVVPIPDVKGREEILGVHTRKTVLSTAIDLSVIARGTPGFSGADLANLVNEAALLAARNDKKEIEISDMEEAKDKVLMGVERRSMIIPYQERRNTAYHEAGHALVAKMMPDSDPIHKVTIIPRGQGARPHAAAAHRRETHVFERLPSGQHHHSPRREGGGRDRPQPSDDRSGQRHRAGHGDRQKDGLRVGHE